jgi:hypothetical protein
MARVAARRRRWAKGGTGLEYRKSGFVGFVYLVFSRSFRDFFGHFRVFWVRLVDSVTVSWLSQKMEEVRCSRVLHSML